MATTLIEQRRALEHQRDEASAVLRACDLGIATASTDENYKVAAAGRIRALEILNETEMALQNLDRLAAQ